MADIELVIKIPEDYYEIIKHDVDKGMDYLPCVLIAEGTPLPKNHGRLIDENDLWFEDIDDISCVTQRNVENAPTIIEADKESDGEK